MPACLYIVATPIGNLEDISKRALRILTEADLIAAEDTRNAKKLLQLYSLPAKELIAYHDHNETDTAEKLILRIKNGELTLALISDAGTPCISDPGYRLTALAHAQGIKVIPIPGPSALTSLVSASGLPSNKIYFVGFLPTKSGAKISELKAWQNLEDTSIVFLESLNRLEDTLTHLQELYPHSQICLGRELTKLHEEIVLMDLEKALEWVKNHSTLKGEITCMFKFTKTFLEAKDDKDSLKKKIGKQAAQALREGAPLKSLLIAYQDCGLSRKELYDLLLSVKG